MPIKFEVALGRYSNVSSGFQITLKTNHIQLHLRATIVPLTKTSAEK